MNNKWDFFKQWIIALEPGILVNEREVEDMFAPDLSGYGVYTGVSKDRIQMWLLSLMNAGFLRMEGFKYFRTDLQP